MKIKETRAGGGYHKVSREGYNSVAIAVFAIIAMFFVTACGVADNRLLKADRVFDPERRLSAAVELLDRGRYEEAREALVGIKQRDHTGRFGPIAQLKIADSYMRDGWPSIGIREYRRFLALYPDNRYAFYAQYRIAMAYYEQAKHPDRNLGAALNAIQEFTRLNELFPRNPFREEANFRISRSKAIAASGEFVIGKFYYRRGVYIAAINRFEGLLEQFPDHRERDRTLLFLGKSYKKLQKEDKAREAFGKLIEEYPLSKLVPRALRLKGIRD